MKFNFNEGLAKLLHTLFGRKQAGSTKIEEGFLSQCLEDYTTALNSNEWSDVRKSRKRLEDSFAIIDIMVTPSGKRANDFGFSTSLGFKFGFKDRNRIKDLRHLEGLRKIYERAKQEGSGEEISAYERVLQEHGREFKDAHEKYNRLLASYLKEHPALLGFFYFCEDEIRGKFNGRPIGALEISTAPKLKIDHFDYLDSLSFSRKLFIEEDDIKKKTLDKISLDRCGLCNSPVLDENEIGVPDLSYIYGLGVYHGLCGKSPCLRYYLGYSLYVGVIKNPYIDKAKSIFKGKIDLEITDRELRKIRKEFGQLFHNELQQIISLGSI